jgi:hypothetical protein
VNILLRVILAGLLTGGMLIGAVLFPSIDATADSIPHEVFFPLVLKQSPLPEIQIVNIQAETFPPPYGYGLRMEYEFSNLDHIQGRTPDFATTQYSLDEGITWHTDEAYRPSEYRWDNIHGDIPCGSTTYNLKSNHSYLLRIILTWHDDHGTYQTFSNPMEATTESYDCQDLDQDQVPDALEQALAEKFFPNLWVRWHVSDRQQFYAFQDLYGGTLPFTVQPYISNFYVAGVEQDSGTTYGSYCDGDNYQCLEIRYGLAYIWDCGDDPNNGCNGINHHLGDTELYAVLVARQGADQSWSTPWEIAKEDVDAWRQVMSETFAHWNTITDSSTCHYYMSPRITPATLYVAEGKHATYHSVRDCDRGGLFGSDYCVDEAHGGLNLRDDLDPFELQNIGNPEEHFLFDTKILQPSDPSQKTYDMWSGSDFGSVGAYQEPLNAELPWGYWWWYNSPEGSGCGDLCGCRSGD